MRQFKMTRSIVAEEFKCSNCNSLKKSKNIATNTANIVEKLCNGCYGLLLSKNSIERVEK